jgi:hypothetical protein
VAVEHALVNYTIEALSDWTGPPASSMYGWQCTCGETYRYRHYAAQNWGATKVLNWTFSKHCGQPDPQPWVTF